MKAKDLLKAVLYNSLDIEQCGVRYIEDNDVSICFPVSDSCSVNDGEYFYIYLEDEDELEETERFLSIYGMKDHFDYAFPLVETAEWVGLVRIDD